MVASPLASEAPHVERSLESYLARLDAVGPEQLADELRVPVLVGGGHADQSHGSRSFRTDHWRRSELASAVGHSSTLYELSVLVDHVFEIRKRRAGLFPEQIGVGRAPNVDIVIPSPRISKYHAYFGRDADGYLVADAGSSNGTKLNGVNLPPREPRRMNENETIVLGGLPFLFLQPQGFVALLQRRLDE